MTHMIYPMTNLTATEQLDIERGEGVYVYDSSGIWPTLITNCIGKNIVILQCGVEFFYRA
jgi:hypothetical protein